MTRKKKFLLGVLLLLILSQLPFAYRRYKIGRLHSAIQAINAERVRDPTTQPAFTEYVGVIHVHSFLGGHSKGSFEEIISAARSNQLSFVVMTEHTSGDFNTAAMTLKGLHAGVLFVNGNEVSTATSDRLLIIPGDEAASGQSLAIEELLTITRSRSALSFVAYPQEFKPWSGAVDGVEVYNVYTNARSVNPFVMFFDGLWTYRSYPELLFANFYRRPDENLQSWDAAVTTSRRRLVAVAGNDAHSNVGINLQDSSGQSLLGLHLDPYARSFKLVRIHALIPKNETLSTETLLSALAAGHCFIGFDLFGDTSGFSFSALDADQTRIQGDEITLSDQVRFEVKTPVASRIVLFKDGSRVEDRTGQMKQEFLIKEKGSYRVEVYLPQLRSPVSQQPWIISNPIYVR